MMSYRHGVLRRLLQRVLIRTESKIGRNFAALHGNLFLGELRLRLRLRLKALCVYDDEKSLRGSQSEKMPDFTIQFKIKHRVHNIHNTYVMNEFLTAHRSFSLLRMFEDRQIAVFGGKCRF